MFFDKKNMLKSEIRFLKCLFLLIKMILPVHSHFNPVISFHPYEGLHLSQTPEDMESIQEAYSIVGKSPVTSFVGKYWASDLAI